MYYDKNYDQVISEVTPFFIRQTHTIQHFLSQDLTVSQFQRQLDNIFFNRIVHTYIIIRSSTEKHRFCHKKFLLCSYCNVLR